VGQSFFQVGTYKGYFYIREKSSASFFIDVYIINLFFLPFYLFNKNCYPFQSSLSISTIDVFNVIVFMIIVYVTAGLEYHRLLPRKGQERIPILFYFPSPPFLERKNIWKPFPIIPEHGQVSPWSKISKDDHSSFVVVGIGSSHGGRLQKSSVLFVLPSTERLL
jgi:hypothetical protein